jgi:hypothetical protein
MCKEMPIIPVNKAVDPKRIIGKKWRAEEEERHKGLLTRKKKTFSAYLQTLQVFLLGRESCRLEKGPKFESG